MHGASVGVARDALVISDKKKVLKTYRSSRSTVRSFCGRCGSPVTWNRDGYENIYVSLGLLEGSAKPPNITNIHVKDKGGYYALR
jgi:hypothetical protein